METDEQMPSTSSTSMETEDIVPSTSAVPFVVPHTTSTGRTNAQRQREYRLRQALNRTPEQVRAFAKAAAERQRRFKLRKSANIALTSGTPESPASTSCSVVERTSVPVVAERTSVPLTNAQRQCALRQGRAASSRTDVQPNTLNILPRKRRCHVKSSPVKPTLQATIFFSNHSERISESGIQPSNECRKSKNSKKHVKKVKKTARTNAQRQKEYRIRKKIQKQQENGRRIPKTNAECQKQFRQKQKEMLQQNESLKQARRNVDAERSKRYRDRIKYRKLSNQHENITTTEQTDNEHVNIDVKIEENPDINDYEESDLKHSRINDVCEDVTDETGNCEENNGCTTKDGFLRTLLNATPPCITNAQRCRNYYYRRKAANELDLPPGGHYLKQHKPKTSTERAKASKQRRNEKVRLLEENNCVEKEIPIDSAVVKPELSFQVHPQSNTLSGNDNQYLLDNNKSYETFEVNSHINKNGSTNYLSTNISYTGNYEQNTTVFTEDITTKPQVIEQPIDVFLKSIEVQLKELSAESCLLAQCGIQQVLTEFRIKDYEKNCTDRRYQSPSPVLPSKPVNLFDELVKVEYEEVPLEFEPKYVGNRVESNCRGLQLNHITDKIIVKTEIDDAESIFKHIEMDQIKLEKDCDVPEE